MVQARILGQIQIVLADTELDEAHEDHPREGEAGKAFRPKLAQSLPAPTVTQEWGPD